MSAPSMTAASEPDGAPRIANLDILRGIAILGILFMNINGMGASSLAGHEWPATIGWTAIDRAAWFTRQVLADGTGRCLLEMLFGAGMGILTARVADNAGRWTVMRRYYLRNVVLFGFGLAHIFLLLWPGDILHLYALCALIAFPFRKLPARWLLTIGLFYAIATFGVRSMGVYSVLIENVHVAEATAHRAAGQPITKTERKALRSNAAWHRQIRQQHIEIAREDARRTANFLLWRYALVNDYVGRLNLYGRLWTLGEVVCAMLFGLGLFKLGILQGQRSATFYARMAFVGYLVGGTIRAIAAWQTSAFGDGISIDWNLGETGRIAMTLGHIGLVSLLLKQGWGQRLLAPFKAAGRTALSIYICQTLICLWVLYPPFALGLYGTQGWAGLMATALVVDAALLVLAGWWVTRFRIAPVEWAWRSIVEGRRLPFRRAPQSNLGGV